MKLNKKGIMNPLGEKMKKIHNNYSMIIEIIYKCKLILETTFRAFALQKLLLAKLHKISLININFSSYL